jgi:tricarballylate dehydrogenase
VVIRRRCDVLVVGAGNAALCAALAAQEEGADVMVIERAPESDRGGNTCYTAGAMRVAYQGLDEILTLVPDLAPDEVANTDFGAYSVQQFFDDIARVTEYRADPDLAYILASESHATLCWMRGNGVRFLPLYGRQAFSQNGNFTFWGGLTLQVSGGGIGLVEALAAALEERDVRIHYDARLMRLIADDSGVKGAEVREGGVTQEVLASSVVLACGGFQSNAEWRARYLGPNWDLAKVRGTRFNTGDGLRAALEVNAMPWGHWSACHAVAWDSNAPDFGDLIVGDGYQKHSYPFGIMVNSQGERFLDEGADFRNFTYAKYGRLILEQPQQRAWQVFDAKVAHLLRDEYRIRQVTKVRAGSLNELGTRMQVDTDRFLRTVENYNRAIGTDVTFNPNVLDGRATIGLTPPKSNWANTIDTPPFEAYEVTCGITFTFGGVRITPTGQVMDTDGRPIPGLFAAGEIVGGIFYFNYPGGAGLTSGSVFGRRAGTAAAQGVTQRSEMSVRGQDAP